ncbi:hypothetical protein SCLCIDRAFT_837695 [Scleroderma citrinum Foug A]|uniref:Uncharacterized protein n=1 Tax=Scleroderma citrinum Foug A TaxID=1036808 RepID=A0A0C2ZKT5_9AGAM|nr:hypothetical protein SCLCIDRAFT_837695 [Scleroderma citrinum Foug A]
MSAPQCPGEEVTTGPPRRHRTATLSDLTSRPVRLRRFIHVHLGAATLFLVMRFNCHHFFPLNILMPIQHTGIWMG